jgi:polyhydroxyalkanoate synthesis regulator phasin
MHARLAVSVVLWGFCGCAVAQDIPGIEICTKERDLNRRTSCLQSNVEFLQQQMSRQAADAQQKLSAASTEISALKGAVEMLRTRIEQLQAAPKPPAAK